MWGAGAQFGLNNGRLVLESLGNGATGLDPSMGCPPPNWRLKPINGVLVLEPLMGETLIEEQLIVDVLIGQLFWTR